jgi:hypothetical protein
MKISVAANKGRDGGIYDAIQMESIRQTQKPGVLLLFSFFDYGA